MIILPDKHVPRAKLLMPVLDREWRTPSQAQYKDFRGNENTTLFRLEARLNDGFLKWRGWFQDRADADAFLYAMAKGTLRYEKTLWRLPTPEWSPDLGDYLSYEFATVTILTTAGSLQTYTSPSDWNNSSNQIECLGAGASGATSSASTHSHGGGGGAYSSITNFSFATPGTTTASYQVGTGGAARTGSAFSGNAGGSTWFNSTTDPGNGADNSKCSADGATGGTNTATNGGGASGLTTLSWGQTKFAGGRGGNFTASGGTGGSGGGGAGGPNGAGGNGVDSSSTSANVATNGGTANGGTVAGGTGTITGSSSGTAGSGLSGTQFGPSHGCGSGGSSCGTTGTATAGSGGNYGGGGGGARCGGTPTSGAGRQGLIVIEYTPSAGISLANINLPMLGM